MRAMLAAGCLAAGCASANVDLSGSDAPRGGEPPIVVDGPPGIDAPPIDAMLMSVTMSETGSTTVTPTKIGCQQNNPATGFTEENSYYRIFPLSDFGVTSTFHVSSVTFSVETATSGNGVSQPATINIGTYGGTLNAGSFPVGQLLLAATANIQIPQNAPAVTTPIASFTPNNVTIATGSNMYVEVLVPNGTAASNTFYIGSNAGTETHPSYIRAPDCGAVSPTTYAQVVGTPAIRLLITVDGQF